MKKFNFIIAACLIMGASFSYAQNTWDGTSTSTTTTNGVVTIGANNPTSYSIAPTTKLRILENNPFLQLKDSTADPLPAVRPTGCGIRLTSYNNSFEIKSYTNSMFGQGLFIHNPASTSNLGLSIYDSRIFIGGVALSGAPLASKFGDVNITANASASRFTVHGNNFSAPVLDANYNFGAYGNSLFDGGIDIKRNGGAIDKNVMLKLNNYWNGTSGALNEPTILFDNGTTSTTYGTFGWAMGAQVAGASYFRIGKYESLSSPLTYSEYFRIMNGGKVVVGDYSNIISTKPNAFSGDFKLFVQTGLLTEKIKVAVVPNWADYVFAKNYKLRPLSEVEAFINENQHLPEIPSAEEVSKNGLDLVEMDTKLLQKVEELTLYMIELKKENESLKKRLEVVESNQ